MSANFRVDQRNHEDGRAVLSWQVHFLSRRGMLMLAIPLFLLTLYFALPLSLHLLSQHVPGADLTTSGQAMLELDSTCSPFSALTNCISLAIGQPPAW